MDEGRESQRKCITSEEGRWKMEGGIVNGDTRMRVICLRCSIFISTFCMNAMSTCLKPAMSVQISFEERAH